MSRLNWVAVGSNQDLVNKQTLRQEIFAEWGLAAIGTQTNAIPVIIKSVDAYISIILLARKMAKIMYYIIFKNNWELLFLWWSILEYIIYVVTRRGGAVHGLKTLIKTSIINSANNWITTLICAKVFGW